jgi:elongation factor G
MRVVDSAKLRNIAFIGHGSTGKTSLVEAICYATGITTRLGRIEDGNTITDFEPEEKNKGYSISNAMAWCDWNKHRINLIDTPGGANFISEAHFAMDVTDGVLMTICAASGVEVQTEKLWDIAVAKKLPRAFFINKLDRERANFDKAVSAIKDSFKINLIVLHLPIGQEASFEGIIDVISGKAYKFDDAGKPIPCDVPADMVDKLEETRTETIESIAENSEELMDLYLGGEELPAEKVIAVLKDSVASGDAYPLLCGSATKCIGISMLLDLLTESFPSPLDRPAVSAKKPGSDEVIEITPSEDGPISAIVFKTSSSFAGTASFIRIFSGTMGSDFSAENIDTDTTERIGQYLKIIAKNTEPIEKAVCGDIIAAVKMKNTKTGHTLCGRQNPHKLDLVHIPTPTLSFSVTPKTKGDEDKLITGLLKIAEDDPTFKVNKDKQTREIILSGMGTGHIDVIMSTLERRFKIQGVLQTPKVPYCETIKTKANSRYRHKKQTGGRGQFGECEIVLSPKPRGEGYEFLDKIVGGVIPKTFIPAVDKGIRETMNKGPLAGFPTVDFQVALVDGKTHDVDSSEQAFKMAGSQAFKQGILKASPTLLEPIYRLVIIVPEECTGDIMGDLSGRRGQVEGYETVGKNTVVRAQVPLAEILRYEPDIRSMTSGRGTFTTELAHYQEVPHELAQKIIDGRNKEKQEEA